MNPGRLLSRKTPRTSVSERGSSKKNGFEIGLMKLSKQWSLGSIPRIRWRSLKQSQQSNSSHSPHAHGSQNCESSRAGQHSVGPSAMAAETQVKNSQANP